MSTEVMTVAENIKIGDILNGESVTQEPYKNGENVIITTSRGDVTYETGEIVVVERVS